ncbi:NB-ARC domain-containing protein [Paractinoplanes maris]|uniref:NB-ARC domain-containing protein n=1 Tax=Paractinoplanes maris TaxID=1734446 RepID=UPI00202213A3|nr:NB-ARC domain-containing protein [Actinoplanes maris]
MSREGTEGVQSPSALRDFFAELRELARVREGSVVSGREIANRANLSPSHTHRVLTGVKVPSVEFAEAMVRALGGSALQLSRAKALVEAAPRPEPGPAKPSDLPEETRAFAGRVDYLHAISAASETHGRLLVTGTGGMGKSWLVSRWAHQNARRFGSGQLYADLHGFDDAVQPTMPEELIEEFLLALGVTKLPDSAPRRAALYRRLTNRRMLVVLDNAADATQVRALLPGRGSTLLVTSRNDLTDLQVHHGARRIVLDPMTDGEALDLMIIRLGRGRVESESEAATEIVKACAGHPLALSIVAARLETYPDWSLASLAAELGNDDRRLRVLDRLATVLSWSDRFDPPMRRAMCLLSTAPVTELGVDAVAALLGMPARDVDDCLREFEGAGLLQRKADSRYFMHPLVRLYWMHQTPEVLGDDAAQAAVRRLVDFLLHSAFDGERLLSPQRPAITLTDTTRDVRPAPLRTAAEAMGWFDAEGTTLLAMQRAAAERDWDSAVWQLAWSMDDYLYRRGLAEPHRRAWRLGLEAAERLGVARIVALAHLCLGRVSREVHHLERALRLIPDDDLASRAQAHRVMALILESATETRRSLHHAIAALRLFRVLGLPVWEAVQLNAIGEQVAGIGHPDTGRELCRRALDLHQRHHHRPGEAATEDGLGTVEKHAGAIEAAKNHYERAIEIYLEIGNDSSAADTLGRLGEMIADTDGAEGERVLRRALRLFREQRRMGEADRIRKLMRR